MLWPFFEGNQRSIKCIAAYIESFPCGKPAGYKLESQRSNKVIFQVQGHVSRAKHGFIPHCRYIKWRPETHFISTKDVHFIVSYTWGILLSQSLHKLLPSTTVHNKACTKSTSATKSPAQTKSLAQRNHQHNEITSTTTSPAQQHHQHNGITTTCHTPHFTHCTLHTTLYTSQFTLHTLHFTLRTPHFTLYTPHSTLYT